MDRPRIVSTLPWSRRKAWQERVETIRREGSWVSVMRRVVNAAERADAVILDGASGGSVRLTDFGIAAVLARRVHGPAVVITDATWKAGINPADRVANQLGLRAIDSPRVTYTVFSRGELVTFPRTWGVSPERVVFTPYLFNTSDAEMAGRISEEGGVFAGGNSLRDFRPLLEAARSIPVRVDLATYLVPPKAVADLPNVHVGMVTQARYMELLRMARVVVVPLCITHDRSAGQQTYLNSMAYGKLVIVPDVMGVRDYIDPMRTGIIVPPGDTVALRDAILWALDPAHADEVHAICERAKEHALRFHNPEVYVERVIKVADDAVERLRARGPRSIDEIRA
jgi:glycosyltransferase involved in cell wall biosynthesis